MSVQKEPKFLAIGEVAERSGVASSALRFYETRGLIQSLRTGGNQRRYHPSMLRRIAVIQVAQTLGLTLEEIASALASLPDNRTPNKRDWDRLATKWGRQLDERIEQLQHLRHNLSGCIGCGCLSMRKCALFNPDDAISADGPGPRYLIDPPYEIDPETGEPVWE
ncbi:MAG: redox-sensitive transcriptional activator SoxR [Endozoicomonas sp.]